MTAKAVSLRIQDKKVWSGKELEGHAPSWPTLLRQMKFKHEDFKTVPEELRSILNGLEEYRHRNLFPPNYRHDDIASELSQGSHPSYTIAVFEEILATEHRNDKRFVKIRREKIISELDEKVSRVFDREINERMASSPFGLEDHQTVSTSW